MVPKQAHKTLPSSYIQSHMLYGILNWSCTKYTLEPWNNPDLLDFDLFNIEIRPFLRRYGILAKS